MMRAAPRRAGRRGGAAARGEPAAGSAMLLPTAPAFLHLQARRRGPHGGIIFRRRHVTFGELASTADALAHWLARRGAGGRIGIMAANGPAIAAATYATWGLGGVAVPISARSTVEETAGLLTHARCTALLCDAPRIEVARAAATGAGVPLIALEADLPLQPRVVRRPRATPGAVAARRSRPDDLAVLAYTSGTTGRPKGAMISHANLFWAALACGGARGDDQDGIGASISPLTHTPVLVSHLLCRLLAGATTVLLERFDLPALLESVERHGITDLPLIGGMVFDVVAMGELPA